MKNIILSLFDYSGNWSEPYKNNNFEVIQIDEKLGTNILDWDYKIINKDRIFGILAAPPCTDFSLSGACWWKEKDKKGITKKSIDLVKKTLEIINYFNPNFWALENPVGRIEKLIPELKSKKMITFNPCDFGDPYTKKTILYGVFNPWLIQNPVKPVKGSHSLDSYLQKKGIKLPCYSKRGELRSVTPKGFAYAFYEANH